MPIESRSAEAEDRPAVSPNTASQSMPEIQVGLLTGGQDRHYAFGLAMSLVARGIHLEVVGGDEIDSPEMHSTPGVKFLDLRESREHNVSFTRKVSRVLRYYAKLIRYATSTKSKLLHILWNNRFEYFDRTVLMVYYKLIGKKVVLTAHNVNTRKRDSRDTFLNRVTLRVQYQLADAVFVHTPQMKSQLVEEYGVSEDAVTVIPYGINNAVPNMDLTPVEARRRFGLRSGEKAILFFGAIAPYKGLDILVSAFLGITASDSSYRLIIAGAPKSGCERYLLEVQRSIDAMKDPEQVIQRIEFIPDDEMEMYFKAADLLVLPYKGIFQSGVLFLGYSYGLPVVATDVGAFRDDVVEEQTGFLCRPNDPVDLARAIRKYFSSDLFAELDRRRQRIREFTETRHTWDQVAQITRDVYCDVLGIGVRRS